MIIKLMTITPDAEKHIEQCARTCYDSFDKMKEEVNGAFLKGLLKSGHLSVFEHASASSMSRRSVGLVPTSLFVIALCLSASSRNGIARTREGVLPCQLQ